MDSRGPGRTRGRGLGVEGSQAHTPSARQEETAGRGPCPEGSGTSPDRLPGRPWPGRSPDRERPQFADVPQPRDAVAVTRAGKGVTVDLHSRPCALPVPVRRLAAYHRRPPARRPSPGPCPVSGAGPLACRPVASRAAAAPVPNPELAARERAATSIAGGSRPSAGDIRNLQDRKSTRLNSSHANISY